jgi:hypothetical protein
VDKVAGFLEVGRTNDTYEIVIKLPASKLDANDTTRILLSPRYARHLANLLIENATCAEAEAVGTQPQSRPYRRRKHRGGSSGPQ